MADQVNPMGSLAPGLSSAFLASSSPRPASEKVRPAKISNSQPQEMANRPATESVKTTNAAVEELNSHLQEAGSELKFQIDKETGRTIFKVVNPSNGEVLLQVPSEEVMALAHNLRAIQDQKGASGVLVDKQG